MKQKSNHSAGFSLLELIFAIALFSIATGAIISLTIHAQINNSISASSAQAERLAEQGIEAARAIRDNNFLSLTAGDHGVTDTNGYWEFNGASDTIENFYERKVTVEDAYRDGDGEIVVGPTANIDLDTKKVSSTVEWEQEGVEQEIQLISYLSNHRGQDWIETLTENEFNEGNFNNTTVIETSSPPADNGSIVLRASDLYADDLITANILDKGVDVAVAGNYAYTVTADNNRSFVVVDISDIADPDRIDELDINGGGTDVKIAGNYAYVTTDKQENGLVIVDISTPSDTIMASFLDINSNKGNNILLHQSLAYITTDNSNEGLIVVNVGNPLAPTLVNTLDINNKANGMAIKDNYLYVAVDESQDGLAILDISNPHSPVLMNTVDLGQTGDDVIIKDNYLYVTSKKTFQIYDLTNPLNPQLLQNIAVSHDVNDIALWGPYALVTTHDQSNGLAVFDITTPASAYFINYLGIDDKGGGLEVVGDYVFVSTHSNSQGLTIFSALDIILDRYQSSGNYESQIFDSGSTSTVYNGLYWEETLAPSSTIIFQARTGDSSTSILSETWVGPDGTNSSYYDVSRMPIALDPGTSGTQYFQYKAYLTGDTYSTPELEEVKVNFTP